MELAKEKHKLVNGVNVEALFGTIDAIKDTPIISQFQFRANNKWINGGHNHTTIKEFYGAQKVHTHEKPFECSYCDATFSQRASLNTHHNGHVNRGDVPVMETIVNSG